MWLVPRGASHATLLRSPYEAAIEARTRLPRVDASRPGDERRSEVRRFVRVVARLVVVAGVVGAVIRVWQKVLRGSSGASGGHAIRTGSFDNWPAVPVAADRRRSGT